MRFRNMTRSSSHKWAMLRNLVTSLIEHERIITTTAKAKEMRTLAEKVITMAKKPDKLHGRRLANKIVRTDQARTKLMRVLGPRYEHRDGGYTRIMKLAKPRKGDGADMSVIEYVDRPGEIRAARPPRKLREMAMAAAANKNDNNTSSSLDELMAKLGLQETDLANAKPVVQE